MQHEIVDTHDLLRSDGNLVESGWARKPLLRYNREHIHYPPKRIKEWHYFFCGDETYGIGFSLANIGPLHTFSLSFLDFKNRAAMNASSICSAKDSAMVMPDDPFGSLRFKGDTAECRITGGREQILVNAEWKGFKDKEPLLIDLTLYLPAGDTLYHCFPFTEKKGQFFYAHKMDNIRLGGGFSLGDLRYTFNPDRAFAVQDWGRGVWPKKTHAYWGGGNGSAEGKPVSFNIGCDYRFADTSAATENALFYEGTIHKLSDVTFHVDETPAEWLEPWRFSSSDGRFELRMDPLLDRHTEGPLGPSHQVFGYYSGTVTLDNGQKLSLRNIFGFAEKNVYRWGFMETKAPALFALAKFLGRFRRKKGP